MVRKLLLMAVAGAFALPSSAVAADEARLSTVSANLTLMRHEQLPPAASADLAEIESWAVAMRDGELAEQRGGFAGLALSVWFSAFVDNLGNASGQATVDADGNIVVTAGDGTTVTASDPTLSPTGTSNVNISTVIGDFGGPASGFFQIAQVPGSFNVVNNNMFVQLAIINVTDQIDLATLQSMLTAGTLP